MIHHLSSPSPCSERRVLHEGVIEFPSLADDEKMVFVNEQGMGGGEGSESEAVKSSGELWMRGREEKEVASTQREFSSKVDQDNVKRFTHDSDPTKR